MPNTVNRQRHWKLRIKWDPRDLWFGLYWTRIRGHHPSADGMAFYVCLLPCLPIILSFDYGWEGWIE